MKVDIQLCYRQLTQKFLNNIFEQHAHVMFDSGCQKSYITVDLKKQLHVKTICNEKIIIKTFGSAEGKVSIVDVVNLKIKCRNNEFVNIEALCVPVICSPLMGQKPFEISKTHAKFKKLYLVDFTLDIEEKNSILIGLDYYFSFIKGNVICSESDNLVALESKLGWILCGTHETGERISNNHIYLVDCFSKEPETIDSTLNKFLKTESSEFSDTENDCVKAFKENLIFNGSRYEIKLPFRSHTDFTPNNYVVAEKRLISLREQLKKDSNLLFEYDKIINDYLRISIIEKIPLNQNIESGAIHYLPHRAVVKSEWETTKVRVVFDASLKLSDEPSLNDLLYAEPYLLPKLYEILLRFRRGKIALVADMKQAFLQIEVNKSHRDFLRFLWYDSITADNPNIVTFRFNRILFGLNSSPFDVEGTLQMHMRNYDFTYHDIDLVQKFIRDLYMEHTTNTFKDIETAIMFYNKIKIYLSEGGFELRKWETNDSTIRAFLHQDKTSYQFNLVKNREKKGIREVLGLNWNSQRDEFLFEFQNLVNQANKLTCTKRNVLKVGGSLFDLLGYLSPVTLQTKSLFKNICEPKSDWNNDLIEPLCSKWKNFVYSFKFLTFSVPRCVFYSEDFVNFIELQGFADSSKSSVCSSYLCLNNNQQGN